MKNILFIIAFTIICSNNIIAQTEGTEIQNEVEITLQENIGSTDGFFSYSENYNTKRYSSSITPILPYEHELLGNQSADNAVPTGSGLLILTCIGIGYAAHKKNRSK